MVLSTKYLFFLLSTFLLPFFGGALVVRAMDRPSVILVPGAFHKAAVYGKVKTLLGQHNYNDVEAVDLPSVGSVVGREADTTKVRAKIIQRVAKGKNVILVGNSYGATVLGEAVKSLTSRGNGYGSIIGIIMLSGFIPYISEVEEPNSRPDIRQVAPSYFRFSGYGNSVTKVYWDNDLIKYPPNLTFYNLLPTSEANHWSSKLEYSSFKALNATATFIPYTGAFRCKYVIGSQDNSIPPSWASTFIDQPGAMWENETIDADHTPMLSRPNKVVEIIRRFAGETV